MIIVCEADDGRATSEIASDWEHVPDDPFAVRVEFIGFDRVWVFSLDMIREALKSSWLNIGVHNVHMMCGAVNLYIHISRGSQKTKFKFPVDEVREFIGQVDDSKAEEILSRELDEFLETL